MGCLRKHVTEDRTSTDLSQEDAQVWSKRMKKNQKGNLSRFIWQMAVQPVSEYVFHMTTTLTLMLANVIHDAIQPQAQQQTNFTAFVHKYTELNNYFDYCPVQQMWIGETVQSFVKAKQTPSFLELLPVSVGHTNQNLSLRDS